MNIHLIAQIYQPEPGGIFAADLAHHWAAQGHRLTVWTAADALSQGGIEVIRLANVYDRGSLGGRVSSQLGFFARAALELKRRVHATELPKLVVVVGSPALPTFLPALAWRHPSLRVIQWVYDLYPEALLALRARNVALRALAGPTRAALDFAWRGADAVVAISEAMAARVRSRVPQANVRAISLWAPAGIVGRTDRAPKLRRTRGIEEGAFVVVYHGNLGLAYDFGPILRAARALSGDLNVVFAIVGDGAQRRMLSERVTAERLGNVRLFPPVDVGDLPDSLAMGDCHLVSVREGWNGLAFPSKFISALATGRPVLVIGPKETELAEVVRANACGAVVPSEGDALMDAVRTLRNHPQSVQSQGDRARSAYQRLFDRERALAAWDALRAELE